MKRRALITATAVMLVALMCLVTASYAWFTAGSEAKIETFDVKVEGADAALQLSIDGANYMSTLTKTDFTSREGQKVPDTLKAVSTVDCKTFFADKYADNVWTGIAANGTEYIAIDFYAKAPVDGSANFNISFASSTKEGNNMSAEKLEAFKKAVKIGYKVGAADDAYTTYDIVADVSAEDGSQLDAYQPMKSLNAKAYKKTVADGGNFVPVADSTAAGNSALFGTARTQTAWTSQAVNFTAETAQHFYVVLWLEGMDRQCTGSFDMNSVEISIGFSDWTAA